jgi:hypothetical protein
LFHLRWRFVEPDFHANCPQISVARENVGSVLSQNVERRGQQRRAARIARQNVSNCHGLVCTVPRLKPRALQRIEPKSHNGRS